MLVYPALSPSSLSWHMKLRILILLRSCEVCRVTSVKSNCNAYVISYETLDYGRLAAFFYHLRDEGLIPYQLVAYEPMSKAVMLRTIMHGRMEVFLQPAS